MPTSSFDKSHPLITIETYLLCSTVWLSTHLNPLERLRTIPTNDSITTHESDIHQSCYGTLFRSPPDLSRSLDQVELCLSPDEKWIWQLERSPALPNYLQKPVAARTRLVKPTTRWDRGRLTYQTVSARLTKASADLP